MWQSINICLWLAMVGATFHPTPDNVGKAIAIAGLVMAACWQHAAVRGFFKYKNRKASTEVVFKK